MTKPMSDTIVIRSRACTIYAAPAPHYLLIQTTGEHKLSTLEKEVEHIKSLTNAPFLLAAFEVTDWNKELSPWNAHPVFGKEPFGCGAGETLAYLEDTLIPELTKRYSMNEDIPVILGGYSLAGLFALWSAYTSDRFAAVKSIYLSLVKKEEKTRNQTMAAVGDNIRRQYDP